MIRRFFKAIRIVMKEGGAWYNAPEWTPDDGLKLEGFLRTATGQRLSASLRNQSLSHNMDGVQSGDIHRCGFAAGYMAALRDLQTFSASSAPQDAHSEEDDLTGAAGLEHLSP